VVSNRPGGAGGRDIWLAGRRRTVDGFDPPQPLTELDSAADESSTSLSADGLEIIFSSNRAGGAGGLDLWHARRARTDLPFDAPTRLAELSSSHADSRPSLSADGTTIYFNYAANEEGGDDADIWVATRCLP
jgi:Tol biopolymer transport system component